MVAALTCADCGSRMKRGPDSRPQGLARCHPCRRVEKVQRRCDHCAVMYMPRTDRSRYCSRSCQYGAKQSRRRSCEVCGAEFIAKMREQRTCSRACGVYINSWYGRPKQPAIPTRCRVPDDHPARWFGASSPVRYGRCGWCERTICTGGQHWGNPRTYCSDYCKNRAKRVRRAGREAGDGCFWTWGDFMRIARRFGFCCAYCGEKPDRLDPDHVVPVSRGGRNSIGNILPSCLPCNSDKRDLLLHEWNPDRERRSLPPRCTSWGSEDRRYFHLTFVQAA